MPRSLAILLVIVLLAPNWAAAKPKDEESNKPAPAAKPKEDKEEKPKPPHEHPPQPGHPHPQPGHPHHDHKHPHHNHPPHDHGHPHHDQGQSLEADFIAKVKCATVTGSATVSSSDSEGKLQARINYLLDGATLKIVDVSKVSGNTYLFTLQVTGSHMNFTLPVPFQVNFNGPNNTTIIMPMFCVPGLESVGGQASLSGNSISGTWATSCDNGTMQGQLFPNPCASQGGEGLGVGYYKQSQHFDDWHTWTPGDSFETVFGVTLPQSKTLLQALHTGGGGMNALLRQATAALLNANNPDVNYLYSQTQVIQMVQDAFASGNYEPTKNLFEQQNELGND